jgi:hypothetical protein
MELNKQEIVEKLKKKGSLLPCHRCGNKTFSIIDGYSKFLVDKNIDILPKFTFGRSSVPIILIVCDNCGAITPHAMGALDLLPKEEQKNDL